MSDDSEAALRREIDEATTTATLIATGDRIHETAPALAESAYRKALALEPEHGAALNNLGVACWNQGRHAEALAWFQRAYDLRPDDASVVYNIAGALLNEGRYDEAKRHFELAATLERRPDTLEAYVDLHGY